MQALKIDQHGPASALTVREVSAPAVGPSDVLVEIEAAEINPSDVISAEGRFPLSQAAEAYPHLSGGKVVLIPDRLYTTP